MDTIANLAQELAQQLTMRDDHRQVISAMLETLHDFNADAMDVIKILSASLLVMARAQDTAAGAGAIVAIKLLCLLMPGRDALEVADVALSMLKATTNASGEPRTMHIVVMRNQKE